MTNETNISIGVLAMNKCFFVDPFQHNTPIYIYGPSKRFGPFIFPH